MFFSFVGEDISNVVFFSPFVMNVRPTIVTKAASVLYGSVVAWRNRRFDKGLGVSRASVPIISVGNLSAGGTGKTPFTQALVRLLQEHFPNERPAIVSRGYGRKTRGGIIVLDGTRLLVSDAALCGDEPLLHATALPHTPVVVHEERSEGCKLAAQECGATCIVLDDGFQHRRLHRDMDIVLIDHATLVYPHLLPAGRLREPFQSLSRADVVCFMNNSQPLDLTHPLYTFLRPDTLLLEAEIRSGTLYDTSTNESFIPQTPVCAVAGIANPERFHASLEASGITLSCTLTFRDHERYTQRHAECIVEMARSKQTSVIATTEKDLVKLRAFGDIFALSGCILTALPIKCCILNNKELLSKKLSELFIAK
jgi:tetraacyldisaccharide 4'-kinase